MNTKQVIHSLVEARLIVLDEKFWDPELHPRVPGGTTKGGEFTFKRMGVTGPGDVTRIGGLAAAKYLKPVEPPLGSPEPPKPDQDIAVSTRGVKVPLDPQTLDVKGDKWNKIVARRLEYEYKRNKPDLDKLVDKIVGNEPIKANWKPVPHPDGKGGFALKSDSGYYGLAPGGGIAKFDTAAQAQDYTPMQSIKSFDDEDDEDEDDQPYTPTSWDEISNDKQEETESHWKDATFQDYLDGEINSWQENGGSYDEAAGTLAFNFKQSKKDFGYTNKEYPVWAMDAVDEVFDEHEEYLKRPIPFTREQILDAVDLEYTKDGYGGGQKPEVDIDDAKLTHPKGWSSDEPGFPGIEPPGLDKFMRNDLVVALKKAFVKQAEDDSSDIEAPDYLSDSAKEYQDQSWSDMEDSQKFDWAKDNDIIEDIESVPAEQIVDIKRPKKIDPLGTDAKYGSKSIDYKMTQALARKMSIKRAAQIMKERNIKTSVGSLEASAREIDSNIWSAWKGSSTSTAGKILQLAIAEELHGRVNYKQLHDDVKWLKEQADKSYDGGYEAVKAYLRAKWETTQWLLDSAGMQTLGLYRGLRSMEFKRGKPVPVETPEKDIGGGYSSSKTYQSLPELDLERNGAASATANPKIANDWGGTVMRIEVPRTAVLSVPVYGQNVYGEQETVITGTAYKGWDAWQSPAPTFDEMPIIHAKD